MLHVAIKNGWVEIVEELIRIGYDLNRPKINGITPASLAAMHGRIKILQLLQEKGADLTRTSQSGISPLYLAMKSRKIQICKYLIDLGMPSYYDENYKRDYSPIFIAVKQAMISLIEMFIDRGDKLEEYTDQQGLTPLTMAANLGVHEVINYLSVRNFNLNSLDPQGYTVLGIYLLK